MYSTGMCKYCPTQMTGIYVKPLGQCYLSVGQLMTMAVDVCRQPWGKMFILPRQVCTQERRASLLKSKYVFLFIGGSLTTNPFHRKDWEPKTNS